MKKILKLKFSGLALLAVGLFMSSCLKNNKYYVDFGSYEPSIELPLAAMKANLPFIVTFDVHDTPTTYFAVVNVASMEKPSSPVTATLALDEAYLNQYNADQLEEDPDYDPYILLPDSTYDVASWNVTVQPGTREGWIPIKIHTSKIDLSKKYILPLTIVDASITISSWNHLMINVGAKNQWDGDYLYTANSNLFNVPQECCASLATAGQNSVSGHLLNYYSNAVIYNIDPVTNAVTVDCPSLSPTATDPASNWDPGTKTLYAKWTAAGGNYIFEEWYVMQ